MVLKHRVLLLFIFTSFFIASCGNESAVTNGDIAEKFRIADSLIFDGNGDGAIALLTTVKPDLKKDAPSYSTYYYLMAESNRKEPELMDRYADSAMAFFNNDERKETYPDEYYNALMVKGNTQFYKKNYHLAFDNYFKANDLVNKEHCDHGAIASKIANVYFFQRNYKAAARYLVEAYKRSTHCREKLSAQRIFYITQGILDNAGLAYEKAGMPDSARYYYNADIDLINEAGKDTRIDPVIVNASKIVVYDNLGGLNLKEGKIAAAESLLTYALEIPVKKQRGIYITPLIKLADLNIATGNLSKAAFYFRHSRAMLDSLPARNTEFEIRWYKLYAYYQEKLGNISEANIALKKFSQLKDSFDNSYAALYRVNVDRELESLRHQQQVVMLKHQEDLVWTYVIGLALTILMALVIIGLTYRNLKTARKHQRLATDQNTRLQKALEDLEKANKNYVRIMRVMAHDLSNPLSGMTGLANILVQEEGFSEEKRHMLQLIEATGNNAMAMIDELLKTGLADENETITTQAHDLKEILNETVALLQFKAKDKHQEIVFQTNNHPVIVQVNREKIWRVFNNLIGNAIKFTPNGGIITIGIHTDTVKNEVIISIADNGIGIPDDYKDKIFEMFTPAKRQGTSGEQPFGLGLSISKKIIEKHKGSIWFESRQGAGTTFYIALPYSG